MSRYYKIGIDYGYSKLKLPYRELRDFWNRSFRELEAGDERRTFLVRDWNDDVSIDDIVSMSLK